MEAASLYKRYEGTWEEVSANATEFSGKRVRLTLLEDRSKTSSTKSPSGRAGAVRPDRVSDETGIIPGLKHGKLLKDWGMQTTRSDITAEEFDAFEKAIAENRAVRRELAQERND